MAFPCISSLTLQRAWWYGNLARWTSNLQIKKVAERNPKWNFEKDSKVHATRKLSDLFPALICAVSAIFTLKVLRKLESVCGVRFVLTVNIHERKKAFSTFLFMEFSSHSPLSPQGKNPDKKRPRLRLHDPSFPLSQCFPTSSSFWNFSRVLFPVLPPSISPFAHTLQFVALFLDLVRVVIFFASLPHPNWMGSFFTRDLFVLLFSHFHPLRAYLSRKSYLADSWELSAFFFLSLSPRPFSWFGGIKKVSSAPHTSTSTPAIRSWFRKKL